MNRHAEKFNYNSMARLSRRPNAVEGLEHIHTCSGCGYVKTQVEVARRIAAPQKVWRFTYAGLL
jgi:hypothetical protein